MKLCTYELQNIFASHLKNYMSQKCKMVNTRKRKSAVWEYFDEPRDCEEGNSDETTSRKKILCNYAILNLLMEGALVILRAISRRSICRNISNW